MSATVYTLPRLLEAMDNNPDVLPTQWLNHNTISYDAEAAAYLTKLLSMETPRARVRESFREVALRSLARGESRVLPIEVGGKNPAIKWKDSDIDVMSSEEWAARATSWVDELAAAFPQHNVAVVAKPSEMVFIDDDKHAEFVAAYEAWSGEKFPRTYATSARENRWQVHFRQTDKSRALGNVPQTMVSGLDFSVRAKNLYVLAEGSEHKSGGIFYDVVDNSPISPMPDKLVEFIQSLVSHAESENKTANAATSTAVSDRWKRDEDGKVIHGQIHPFMLHHAGRLRRNGLTADEIETVLLRIVNDECAAPIDNSKVSAMARSSENWQPEPEGYSLTLNQQPDQPKAQPTEATKQFKVRRLSSTDRGKKLYWLWHNRIPFGALCTLAGDPDEGKSLITLYVAARVTKGERLYDNIADTEAGDVLLLSAEDDTDDTIIPRLRACGADLDRMHVFESVVNPKAPGDERLAQLDADISMIRDYLEKNPAIKVVIIDPISSFLGDANMNREQQVRKVLQPLRDLAKKKGLAVIMVAHFNKNSDTRSAMDRVGGAKALVGMGRSAWTCVREPKPDEPESLTPNGSMPIQHDRRLFLKLKNNLAPSSVNGLVYTIHAANVDVEDEKSGAMVGSEQPMVVWLETTSSTAQDIVIGDRNGVPGRPGKGKDAVEILRKFLETAGGYASMEKIKDAMASNGLHGGTVTRAIGILRLEQHWVGRESYRALPGKMPSLESLRPAVPPTTEPGEPSNPP